MNNEAISMCKHLTYAVVREDVNGQYHWANLIMLDALASGAKGPQPEDVTQMRAEGFERVSCGPIGFWREKPKSYGPAAEDAIEEARR